MERSEIRDCLVACENPGLRGVYHRARIRATRWLHPGYVRCFVIAGLDPQSILFEDSSEERWIRGSSPRMTERIMVERCS
jgi:hypothetical protein